MDLHKKVAFKCAFEELQDGEEPKDTVSTSTNSGRILNLMLSQMPFLLEKLKTKNALKLLIAIFKENNTTWK